MNQNAPNSGRKALRLLGLVLLLGGAGEAGFMAARFLAAQKVRAVAPVRDFLQNAEHEVRDAKALLDQKNELKGALLKKAEERSRNGGLSARLTTLRQLRRRTAKLLSLNAPEVIELDREIRKTKASLRQLPEETRLLSELSAEITRQTAQVARQSARVDEMRAALKEASPPPSPALPFLAAGLLAALAGALCLFRAAPGSVNERPPHVWSEAGGGESPYAELLNTAGELYTPATSPPDAIITRLKTAIDGLMALCAASPDDFEKLLEKPTSDLAAHAAQVALGSLWWTALLPLTADTRRRIVLAGLLHDLVAVNLPQPPSAKVAVAIAHHSAKLVARFPELSAEESEWIAQVLAGVHQATVETNPPPWALYSALLSFCDHAAWQSQAADRPGTLSGSPWKTAFKISLASQPKTGRASPLSLVEDDSAPRARLAGEL